MRRFLKLYRVEQRLFFRSGDVFLFNLCMPIVALLLIGFIGGGKAVGNGDMTYLQSAFAALTSVGICCSAFMSIPIVIVDYRNKKILKHFYCSPCSPVRLLAADVICSGVMSGLSAVLIAVTAMLIFSYRMPGNVLLFMGSWFLTMLSMFSIGLMVASVCRTTRSMNVATSLLYFPMLLFSGATIPFELFPQKMQMIAGVMPLSVGIRLMKATSMGIQVGNCMQEIIVLVGLAVACCVIAVKAFRWE